MLARSYEDLEKRLQAQLKELDTSHHGAEFKPESECEVDSKADHSSCSCEKTPELTDEHEEKTQNEGQKE